MDLNSKSKLKTKNVFLITKRVILKLKENTNILEMDGPYEGQSK